MKFIITNRFTNAALEWDKLGSTSLSLQSRGYMNQMEVETFEDMIKRNQLITLSASASTEYRIEMTDEDWEAKEEAERDASMKEALKGYIPRARRAMHNHVDEDSECTHEEKDHGVCMDCGKDCFDDDIARAELMRDSREDR